MLAVRRLLFIELKRYFINGVRKCFILILEVFHCEVQKIESKLRD